MKISSILLIASLGAVSAFGLPFTASNNNAVKSFRGQNAVPAKAALMRDGLVSVLTCVAYLDHRLVRKRVWLADICGIFSSGDREAKITRQPFLLFCASWFAEGAEFRRVIVSNLAVSDTWWQWWTFHTFRARDILIFDGHVTSLCSVCSTLSQNDIRLTFPLILSVTHFLVNFQVLNAESTAAASSSTSKALSSRGGGMGGVDVPLMLYFLFWYVGNYYYNIVSSIIRNELLWYFYGLDLSL